MTKKVEVTIVKTATIEVDLDEAREYLAREVPESLRDCEERGDLVGIAEIYVSFVEGLELYPCFDREIFAVPVEGSNVGTEGDDHDA